MVNLKRNWLEVLQTVQQFCWTQSTAFQQCFKAGLVALNSSRWGLQSPVSVCRKIVGGPAKSTIVFRVMYAPTESIGEKGAYRVEELEEMKRMRLVSCDLEVEWPRIWPEKIYLNFDRQKLSHHLNGWDCTYNFMIRAYNNFRMLVRKLSAQIHVEVTNRHEKPF